VIGALVMCYLSKNEQAIEAGNERLSATAGNPNELAYILVVSEIFVLHGFLAARTLLAKALMAALAVVIVYFIPLTGSRQGLLGLIMIILIYASLKLEFKNIGSSIRSVLVAGLFTLALAGSILYAQRTTYFDRFTDFLESVQTGRIDQKGRTGASVRNRYLFYKYGLDIAAHNPAFGVGLDNFKLAIAEYPGFGGHASYAHSNYVEILADTGVPGFILYFSMYVAIGKRLFRLRGRVKERSDVQLYHTLIVLLSTTLITDFSMVSYYDKIAWIVLSSIIAATLVLERKLANVPSMLHTGKRNAAA
jgi:O-antigen ligase